MNPLMLLLLLLLSFHTIPKIVNFSPSPACNFPAIINFGDSNSDTGGYSATFGPAQFPSGETFFQVPAGRLSDGRLLIDYIAKGIGLPFLSSYMDSLGTNYSHGVNFATVGSPIIDQNISLSLGGYSPFSLSVQSKQFSQFIPRSQSVAKRGGLFKSLMPKESYFTQALYTIDIGQNDLTAGLFAGNNTQDFLPQTIATFSDEIKKIYKLGARYFWIHNTGPLGCLAYALIQRNLSEAGELDQVGCSVFYNKAAQEFNRRLNETLVEIRKELPLAVIIYVDVYSAKYSLFQDPAKYGFEDPLITCCGHGGKYNFDFKVRCGSTAEVNETEVLLGKSCADPSKKVVWDGVHYTDVANEAVFKLISTGRFSYPPRPLGMACNYF